MYIFSILVLSIYGLFFSKEESNLHLLLNSSGSAEDGPEDCNVTTTTTTKDSNGMAAILGLSGRGDGSTDINTVAAVSLESSVLLY